MKEMVNTYVISTNINFHKLTNILSDLPIYAQRSFCGTLANSAEPDQTPQNAASDQVFHCLFTECPMKMLLKTKNTTQQPLKRKWTGPIDNSAKFHQA